MSKDGAFICYLLTEQSSNRHVEIFAFEFKKQGKHVSAMHAPRSIEYVVVEKGSMVVEIGSESIELKAGDALEFRGGLPHTYIQKNNKLCKGTVFIYYGV